MHKSAISSDPPYATTAMPDLLLILPPIDIHRDYRDLNCCKTEVYASVQFELNTA